MCINTQKIMLVRPAIDHFEPFQKQGQKRVRYPILFKDTNRFEYYILVIGLNENGNGYGFPIKNICGYEIQNYQDTLTNEEGIEYNFKKDKHLIITDDVVELGKINPRFRSKRAGKNPLLYKEKNHDTYYIVDKNKCIEISGYRCDLHAISMFKHLKKDNKIEIVLNTRMEISNAFIWVDYHILGDRSFYARDIKDNTLSV